MKEEDCENCVEYVDEKYSERCFECKHYYASQYDEKKNKKMSKKT